jgi:flagellin FlaB
MRNIKRILKKNDLGDMGIGAMIVFIAMVLVAGIAASVLIQTANKLEIQAMTTGQETTREVSTGLQVMDIEGENTGLGGAIARMTITIRARAGSDGIDLANTVIQLSNGTLKTILTYNETKLQFNQSSQDNGSIFLTGPWNMSNENFGILVLQDYDHSLSRQTPVLNRGDVVMLLINTDACFTSAPQGLHPRDDVWGSVNPEEGAPGIFAFRVPSSINDRVYDLY